MNDKVLVKFYAGDDEEEVDILELLGMDLEDWNYMSTIQQDVAIDDEHNSWMWNHGYVGWTRQ